MFLDTAAVIHDDGHAAGGAGPVLSRFDPGDLFGLGGRALRLRRCRLPGWNGFLYGSRLRGRRLGSRFLCRGRGLDGHPLPGRRCCLGRCCCLRGRLCDRGCAFCNRHKYPPGMINIIKTERSQLRFMEEETENKPLPSERNGRLGGRPKKGRSPANGRWDRQGGGEEQTAPLRTGGGNNEGAVWMGGGVTSSEPPPWPWRTSSLSFSLSS